MDWNVIGADVITRLVPVAVVVLVYYAQALFAKIPPLIVNVIAAALTSALSYVTALATSGEWNPVQAAALFGLATLIAEVLKNTGLQQVAQKVTGANLLRK